MVVPPRYVRIVRDTSPTAAEIQTALYRRMTPGRRCELAVEMSVAARRIALEGIRRRHPEYTPEQARFALFRVLVGDELFGKAWPAAPLLAP
jgi:hypothetical protein